MRMVKQIANKVIVVAVFLISANVTGFAFAADNSKESLRDPTRPLGAFAIKAAKAKLDLQALFLRDASREAVINGKRVKVGGVVNGVYILKINEKSVEYQRDGITRTLYLRASVIEKNG